MKKALLAAVAASLVVVFAAPSLAMAQGTMLPPNPGPFNSTVSPTNTSLNQQQISVVTNGGDACSNLKTTGLKGIVNCIIDYFNIAITLIMAAAVVVIVWGAFQMIYSEEKRESGKQRVLWGIVGLFAMVSIWGFVNILNSTFRLANTPQVSAPQFKAP